MKYERPEIFKIRHREDRARQFRLDNVFVNYPITITAGTHLFIVEKRNHNGGMWNPRPHVPSPSSSRGPNINKTEHYDIEKNCEYEFAWLKQNIK